MKVCPNCGSSSQDSAKFCDVCGTALPASAEDSNSQDAEVSNPQSAEVSENSSSADVSVADTSIADASTSGASVTGDSAVGAVNSAAAPDTSGESAAETISETAAPIIDYERPSGWTGAGTMPGQQPTPQVVQIARPIRTEDELPEQFQLIHGWGYVGYTILFSLPVVGLIFMIVFALSNKKLNRMYFARFFFCQLLISVIVFILVLLVLLFTGTLQQIITNFPYYVAWFSQYLTPFVN